MIETYKIVSGKYDSTIAPALLMSDTNITRGNELHLQKFRCKYDMCKFFFTNRVVDHWNSLPNWVLSANNTIMFKIRLGKHWQHQEIIYDFRAQTDGNGSRSEVSRM